MKSGINATAFFKLALYLVELFGTPELAAVCAKALLVDPNQDRQSPYAILDFERDQPALSAATFFSLSLAQMATSTRRFKARPAAVSLLAMGSS